MDLRTAIGKVNKRGMLLVFPINNRKEPASLWSEFFPRSEMRWEWDNDGDTRVADLWHLRERLSSSGKVIYSKWFRGRATVISFELCAAMMVLLKTTADLPVTFQAREVMDLLNEDSPLSTKQLKKQAGLQGRDLEKVYTAALKQLWSRLLIVGFGEVDEGAFPSLAIGSTHVLFEELWQASLQLSEEEARKTVDRFLPKGSSFRKFFDQLVSQMPQSSTDSSTGTTNLDDAGS